MAVKKKSTKPSRQSPGKTTAINRIDRGGFDELNTEPAIERNVLGVRKRFSKVDRVADNAVYASPSFLSDGLSTQDLKKKESKNLSPRPTNVRGMIVGPGIIRPTTRQEEAKVEAPRGDPRRTTPADEGGYISPYRRRQMRLRAQDGK